MIYYTEVSFSGIRASSRYIQPHHSLYSLTKGWKLGIQGLNHCYAGQFSSSSLYAWRNGWRDCPRALERLNHQKSNNSISNEKSCQLQPRQNSEMFANLPRVAATLHLDINDVATSSFFSLYRPINVNTNFRPEYYDLVYQAFLEQTQSTADKRDDKSTPHRTSDVMKTISNAIKSLHEDLSKTTNNSSTAYTTNHENFNASSDTSTGEFDAMQKHILNYIQERQPFPPSDSHDMPTSMKQSNSGFWKVEQKTDTTNCALLRPSSGSNNGSTMKQKLSRYSKSNLTNQTNNIVAHSSKLGRRNNHRARRAMLRGAYIIGRHGLTMRTITMQEGTRPASLQLAGNDASKSRGMFAISVRRQRKLKMKKHKYKKLMKRTRNLRRRLGKI